jgi:hypothetical protein
MSNCGIAILLYVFSAAKNTFDPAEYHRYYRSQQRSVFISLLFKSALFFKALDSSKVNVNQVVESLC